MLNYIIPPIVIVLGLAALVIFIFRKNSRVAEEMINEERGGTIKINPKTDKKKLFRFTQLILRITEKGMQYFKLVSLKFYNKTDNWFRSVKEKREKRQVVAKGEREMGREKLPEANQGRILLIKEEKEIAVGNVALKEEETEIEVEPMISKEVVRPEPRPGVRNEFERALIERIALNPRDIEAYERLGDYYIEIGNFSDSLSCFDQVLKLSPVNRRAKIKVRRLQKIVFNEFSE